jgi:hypothetical protein
MFRALLAHPQERYTSGTWYIACVLCQLAAPCHTKNAYRDAWDYAELWQTFYNSVSQPLSDRGPVIFFLYDKGPGPNKFTRKYLSNFFLSSYTKLV